MELSRKNILFIIIAIVVLIAALILVLFINMRNSSQQTTSGQKNETQNFATLPGAQIAKSPDLSEVKNSTHEELNNVEQKGVEISEKNYKDQLGKIISLDDFAKANGIKIEPRVLQNSGQKDYVSFSCAKAENERPAIGLMLQLRRDVDPKKYQQSYSEMEQNMKSWEKTMFQDLAPLFYPGEIFSKEPVFKETKYTTANKANIVPIRFANLSAESGRQYSIDWGFLNDQVFISSDKDCLRHELDKNADAFEP